MCPVTLPISDTNCISFRFGTNMLHLAPTSSAVSALTFHLWNSQQRGELLAHLPWCLKKQSVETFSQSDMFYYRHYFSVQTITCCDQGQMDQSWRGEIHFFFSSFLKLLAPGFGVSEQITKKGRWKSLTNMAQEKYCV